MQVKLTITDSSKEIVSVFPDVSEPNLIHAASADKIVTTYDLKQERKIGSFMQ